MPLLPLAGYRNSARSLKSKKTSLVIRFAPDAVFVNTPSVMRQLLGPAIGCQPVRSRPFNSVIGLLHAGGVVRRRTGARDAVHSTRVPLLSVIQPASRLPFSFASN